MLYNVYQIIGALIYTILAIIIIILVAFSSIPILYAALIVVTLISGLIYASFVLINVILGVLLPIRDKEFNKKDEKYTLQNDFTDMFNGSQKKKD